MCASRAAFSSSLVGSGALLLEGGERRLAAASNVAKAALQRLARTASASYEQASGLDAVVQARNALNQRRRTLEQAREHVIQAADQARQHREAVMSIRSRIDTLQRSDDLFPILVQQEHELLKRERNSERLQESSEERERNAFRELCDTVEQAQSAEKEYSERTKYWSMMASLIGTLIGVLGSSVLAYRRETVLQTRLGTLEKTVTNWGNTFHLEMASLGGSLSEVKALTHLMNSNLSAPSLVSAASGPVVQQQHRQQDVDELKSEVRRSAAFSAAAAVAALLALCAGSFGSWG